ncbi:hypothetical protein BCR33DRAFT_534370 [Rhizoclosmatium globosum]|uniref:Uncharacterized protein n=1 Tax=Rhizoclosmatium globosum TaxID=329046 RepID=A0A1Y2BC96_9FUNG|nr:hypothetical protein BCR33DRAFT_534370 [Rhizoclosmatium globosum]|eukprot:ORY32384.1 hypothetical protein BCR33DRAFT_534370 [Rhizoclosmatium globosum]
MYGFVVLKRRGTTVVSGRRDGNVKRPFVFARPILVANGGLLEKEGVDSLGTIRIELWPVLLVSRKCPSTKEYVGSNAPVVVSLVNSILSNSNNHVHP